MVTGSPEMTLLTATEIEIISTPQFTDYPNFITCYTQSIAEQVVAFVQHHGSVLVGVTSDTTFTRDLDGHFCRIPAYFHVIPQVVNAAQPFDLGFVSENLDSQVDYFTTRGSGFLLEAIHRFVLCITPYRPLVGSSYIPTPAFLVGKRCLVNIHNKDSRCFLWATNVCVSSPRTPRTQGMYFTLSQI